MEPSASGSIVHPSVRAREIVLFFDVTTMSDSSRYNLLTALVAPRPIAWTVTTSLDGILNAAPFSFFNLMAGTPPVICLGIGARQGIPKDSARNILETGEFVINLVDEQSAHLMNATAIDFDANVDELVEVNLPTVSSQSVAPPRIATSPVALECTLREAISIGNGRNIVLGDIRVAHVIDAAVTDSERGHIDPSALGLIARMHGGGWYLRTSDAFTMRRVDLDEWNRRRRDGPVGV